MIKPFNSNCQRKIDVTNDGESALKRHLALAPFEDKDKNHKLRTPVAGSAKLLSHLKKPESEEVTNDSVKKKNNSTTDNQPTQLSIKTVLEKNNIIDAEIRCCLKVVKSKFSLRSCDNLHSLFSLMFPDRETARKMTLQMDKCKYVINHGFAAIL